MIKGTADPSKDFFKPANFYNLQTAGFAVWIFCLFAMNIFPELTSRDIRLTASLASFMVAIGFLTTSQTWRKFRSLLLVFFNTALIFINASGYNSVTANRTFERSEPLVRQAGFIPGIKEKDWWPDDEMAALNDTLVGDNKKLRGNNRLLIYQLALLKDWLQGALKGAKKEEYDSLVWPKLVPEFNLEDSSLTVMTREERRQLDKLIDSLRFELRYPDTYTQETSYEVNGKTYSSEQMVDSLFKENSSFKLQVSRQSSVINLARQMLGTNVQIFDSLSRKIMGP